MNPRLQALLIGGIAATIAGVGVVLWTPDVTTTRASLIDAGITNDFTPRKLSCNVFYDGGYHEQTFIVAASKTALADGGRDTIWPRTAIAFRSLIVGGDPSCRVVDNPTWAQVPNFDAEPADTPFSCACAPADGGCLLIDGGPARPRTFLAPSTFGAGCLPRVCLEWAGRPETPAACQ